MMRIACTTAAVLVLASLALERGPLSAQGDQHAYYNALLKRSDFWKTYSFRDPAQLEGPRAGGYAGGNDTKYITYSPATDTDPHKQDAAKVTIPAFYPMTSLTAAISATTTTIPMASASSSLYNVPNKAIKIDSEVMAVTGWVNDTTITVQRGAFGTVAVPHAAGAVVGRNANSLANQVRVPLLTDDGHAYLFTWDGYWTDSYLSMSPVSHKAFQFSSGSRTGDSIWFEPQTDFSGGGKTVTCWDKTRHVFAIDFRSYNSPNTSSNWASTTGDEIGPGQTSGQLPRAGIFCVRPNTWVRWWIRINQKVNDWDDLDAWVADETTGPVQVLKGIKVSVSPTGGYPNRIGKFWLEYNTSVDDHLRPDNRDLVSYVRNFVALKGVGDVTNLLVRPVPGAQPLPGPGAPKNVRIFRQ